MYPELISIGNFSISSFGAMMALCFLAGYWIITVEAKRKKLDQRVVGNMFLAAMFGGIVGAKLLYVFENVPLSEILANPGASLLSRGGLTFYGGFFGAIILTWIIAYRNKISMWTVGDLASPALALAYAIGKLRTRVRPAGWLFSIYLILAGLERFFVEFFRSTTPSPIPGLSLAQVMAVAIILIGIVKLYSLRGTDENAPAPESPEKSGRKKRARA